MAQLSQAEVLHAATAAGWSTTPSPSLTFGGQQLSPAEVITGIAYAESGNHTNAVGIGQGADSEVSVGLTQLNQVAGNNGGYSVAQLTDPVNNLRAALGIYNAGLKQGKSPLEAFQGPWQAELGAPGSLPGQANNGADHGSYQNFVMGVLPFLQGRNVPYAGGFPAGQAANYVTPAGQPYSFASLETLIRSRLGHLGSSAPVSANAATATLGAPAVPAAGAAAPSASSPMSLASYTSPLKASGGFGGGIVHDLEVGLVTLGAAVGLYLSITHVMGRSAAVPMPDGTVKTVSTPTGIPEVWWALMWASAVTLWSVFAREDPFCVLGHMTSGAPGACRGTLKGGAVASTVLEAIAGLAAVRGLGGFLRGGPGGGVATGNGEPAASTGSDTTGGSSDSTGTGSADATTGPGEAPIGAGEGAVAAP